MQLPPQPITAQECAGSMRAVRDALDLLGGKWKLPIIVGLVHGPKRFKHLQREVTGITAKMLSKELKELEVNGLITRHVQADVAPVAVTYALAAHGATLYPVIEALQRWGQQHRHYIMHTPAAPVQEPELVA